MVRQKGGCHGGEAAAVGVGVLTELQQVTGIHAAKLSQNPGCAAACFEQGRQGSAAPYCSHCQKALLTADPDTESRDCSMGPIHPHQTTKQASRQCSEVLHLQVHVLLCRSVRVSVGHRSLTWGIQVSTDDPLVPPT